MTSPGASLKRHYPNLTLFPGHERLLIESAISPEVATARGYRSVDTKVTLKRYGFSESQRSVPGLLIPIFRVDGRSECAQYRPDGPRVSKEGKPVKYETPQGVRTALDVHPFSRGKLGDLNTPLFIVEGIRKADAAASRGLCCAAILGVWNWRGKNEQGGLTALGDWEMITLKERLVYLAFDSDLIRNQQVYQAVVRLKRFLEMKGARVAVIRLPVGKGGKKVGLDDYFAAGHTVDEILALATDDLPFPPLVDGEESAGAKRQGRELVLNDPEPWPEPVDGAELLQGMVRLFTRHVVMPDGGVAAAALYVLLSYVFNAFWVLPILAPTSPVMRCGKTTLMRVLHALVHRPLLASNISSSAVFRTVEVFAPTILADEVAAWFNRGALSGNTELQDLFNAGHTRVTATVVRTVGDDYEPRQFSTWCPKVLAMIGKLPDTLRDRAIELPMQRAGPGERVEEIRDDRLVAETEHLRRKAVRWAADHVGVLRNADPSIPLGLNARAKDNWRPLLAIANEVGNGWPEVARRAAETLSAAVVEATTSAKIQLLTDIRTVYAEKNTDRLSTEALLGALHNLPESLWKEWRKGKPLSARQMAGLLKDFGIEPEQLWIDGAKTRGYAMGEAMRVAFVRYLPPVSGRTVEPAPDAEISDFASGRTGSLLSDRETPNAAPDAESTVIPDKRASGESEARDLVGAELEFLREWNRRALAAREDDPTGQQKSKQRNNRREGNMP